MSRFEAFMGHRYDTEIVPLSEVIAPPYDVVTEFDRQVLAARSPYNAIHVELPVPDSTVPYDRYENAAAIFSSWEHEGIIRQDDVPTLYVYRMSFVTELGNKRSTTGVIGAMGLDVAGGEDVLPHERTMPKPRGDRLDLLRACKANLSPIWGLSLAEGLANLCNRAIADTKPAMTASDDHAIIHELWPISDPSHVEAITELVSSTPIVIADGHHRYETAMFYQQERRASNGDLDGSYDLAMAFIVELSTEELFVQPIHRLISGLSEDVDLLESLASFFSISAGPEDIDDLAAALVANNALGLVTAAGNYLLVASSELDEAAEADLDSSRLDIVLASLPTHELVYQHGIRHIADALANGEAQAGFLLRPATVDQIADTAHSGHRMPPKTTFFQPKPRTGVVYRSVAH